MFGIVSVCTEKRGRQAAIENELLRICGVRFLSVTVFAGRNPALQVGRWKRAAKQMERAGVRTALFPAAFSHAALFEKRGIRAADEGYLRQMTAAAVARRAAAQRGIEPRESCVALMGDHMSAALRKALMELALHFRHTILAVPGGGGEICSVLRREYGVSVLRSTGKTQMERADVLLTFGEAVPCGRSGCLWLPCGTVTAQEGFENGADTVRYLLPPKLEEQIPDGCCTNALLSLLLETGAVRTNELEVSEILQNA